jgi:hypothetical protein
MTKQQVVDDYEGLRTRSHWKREDAARVLADWTSSGTSMSAFARQHRLGLHRLQWWRGRLGEACEEQSARLVPAVVRRAPLIALDASVGVVCIDAQGTRIEIHDPQRTDPRWLAAFVLELRGGRS